MLRNVLTAITMYFFCAFVTASESLKLDIMTQHGEGSVLINLLPEAAPKHVERIKQLVADGAYNNVAFHRVIDGFMAQTGDVEFANKTKYNDRLAGTGGSSYPDLKAEFSTISFKAGIVGMARSRNINSANSQFFIMTADNSGLDGNYTVIGEVTEGLELVKALKKGSRTANGKVENPDYIIKASIVE